VAIAFQANNGGADGNDASPTCSSVNASGADRFSLIGIYANGDETISAISRGGQNPTLIRRYNLGSGSSNTLWLYGLVAPNTGVQTISVTKSASSLWAIAESVYTGVDQATPYGTEAVAENSSATPITVDVSAAVGQMVVDVTIAASNTVTVGAGQTERLNFDGGGDLGYRRFCMSEEDGAATVTMSWAPSGPSGRSGIIAVPLNAASGGGGAPTLLGQACL
jgi:hypothetical protein